MKITALYKTVLLIFIILLTNCSTSNVIKNEQLEKTNEETKMDLFDDLKEYNADINHSGVYQMTILDSAPKPLVGEKQFIVMLYKNLKYPAEARKSGLAGTVVVELEIDSAGNVVSTRIKQSASPSLDNAFLNAVNKASSTGFRPGYYQGMPVKTKIIIPTTFSLG